MILKQSCCWVLVYADHILVALQRYVMGLTKHILHVPPPHLTFFSPPPLFFTSNKIFAAVISKNINYTMFNNLGSWSWRWQGGKVPSLFTGHVWRLGLDWSFFWVIPGLSDHGVLFLNFLPHSSKVKHYWMAIGRSSFFLFKYFFFGGLFLVFCRILVPPSGIKPGPLAMKGLSPTHWMTREMGDIVSKTTSYDGSCQGLFHYNSFWLFCFFFAQPYQLELIRWLQKQNAQNRSEETLM